MAKALGCQCRYEREIQKLEKQEFVGLQIEVGHLETNSCVITPAQMVWVGALWERRRS